MSGQWGWDASRLSTGGRVALRRCAGRMIGQADAAALLEFYRAAGDTPRWMEPHLFAAMCMEMLWRAEDRPRVRRMEDMLADAIQVDTDRQNTGLLSRVCAALDTPWTDDGFLLGKLCNLARILRAKDSEVMPDFPALAEDMRKWNREGREVQRQWIRVIFKTVRDRSKAEEDRGGNPS